MARIRDGVTGEGRVQFQQRVDVMKGESNMDGSVRLRGGARPIQVGRNGQRKEKENRRRRNAGLLAKKIEKLGKKLQSQEFLNAASTEEVKSVEDKISRRIAKLRQLDFIDGLDVSSIVEPAQSSLADVSEADDDDILGVQVRSRKRKLTKVNTPGHDEDGEETSGAADVSKVIGLEDSPRKEKTDKRHKKSKKRKLGKALQHSSQHADSIPTNGNLHTEQDCDFINQDSNKTVSHDQHTHKNNSATTSPEKSKQAALLDTITRSRNRSVSIGDDIYETLIAGMLAQPSPPSPMSSIGDWPRNLIDIGRSAIAAPIIRNTQKPIRDRAFKPQAPVETRTPKVRIPTLHKESPIPPPVRNYSLSRTVPTTKDKAQDKFVETTKSSMRVAHNEKASKAHSKIYSESAFKDTQHSATVSPKVIAMKKASTPTAIEKIVPQCDPFTGTKRILPPSRTTVSAKVSLPNNRNSSVAPDVTPTRSSTKSRSKSKSSRERRNEVANGDWEQTAGCLRARIDKESSADDDEVEENTAFSSSYIQSQPHGVSVSGHKFQILKINHGTEKDIPISSEKHAIKICSVAAGRVKIMLGKKNFEIGEGGMWRVRGGEKCIVSNYLDGRDSASIHVCSVDR